jgi:hypothetical protein
VMQGFVGQNRVAVVDGRHAVGWLRDALAALPEPWTVLASRRRSGTEGPPWVRYIVLHPTKGIALVDVDPAELAVAPLEDFFDHTGLAALQPEALPIVAVTLPRDGSVVVAEAIDAAFSRFRCQLNNPYWCEAVVELFLTTSELRLTRLRRIASPIPEPAVPSAVFTPSPTDESSTPVALTLCADTPTSNGELVEPVQCESLAKSERALHDPQELPPPQRTWRSWPISPVTAVVSLLAVAAILLVSRQTWSPTLETAANSMPRLATEAVPHAAKPTTSLAMTAALPVPAAGRAQQVIAPTPTPLAAPATTSAQPSPHPLSDRYAWRSARHASSAPPEQRMAMASARTASDTACADVLHPNRPGGWDYRGPPVPNCLPIRFFGLIGMR